MMIAGNMRMGIVGRILLPTFVGRLADYGKSASERTRIFTLRS